MGEERCSPLRRLVRSRESKEMGRFGVWMTVVCEGLLAKVVDERRDESAEGDIDARCAGSAWM